MQLQNENTIVIDRLVEAYHSSDVRGFADLFAVKTAVYEFSGTLVQQSREEVFEFYENLFREFPANHTEVLYRIVIGDRVIDHERVRTPDAEPFEVLTIYELENREIKRLDFVRQKPAPIILDFNSKFAF